MKKNQKISKILYEGKVVAYGEKDKDATYTASCLIGIVKKCNPMRIVKYRLHPDNGNCVDVEYKVCVFCGKIDEDGHEDKHKDNCDYKIITEEV